MFTYRQLLARKYREEAGDGGDTGGASTTGAATDDSAAGDAAADTSTVLTGDDGADSTTNSDGDAAAASDDSTDNPDEGDGATGNEGSDKVPDTYADFTLPEGMPMDEAALAEATPLLKEMNATQEQAQKFIDLHAKLVQAGSEKQVNDFNQLMSDWRAKAASDSEYGGDNFDENVKIGQAAINKYGTPELKQLLEEQGVGNHPEVIRFMVRVGQTLTEDVPGSTGTSAEQAGDRVEMLYGKDKT